MVVQPLGHGNLPAEARWYESSLEVEAEGRDREGVLAGVVGRELGFGLSAALIRPENLWRLKVRDGRSNSGLHRGPRAM